jgi:ADP-heptose:LPS heptosyltransferase/predicted SAM-dependent methyltransferase
MTWNAQDPYKPEVQKCRDRLVNYCQGIGLDIGCGPEKIIPSAIGVDMAGADINCDLSRGLDIFQPNFFDYVFSSHCLEDFIDTESILRDWWSKIKVGGHLILYLPHRDHYPKMGQPGANQAHQHDFCPDDIFDAMDRIGSYDVVRCETHDELDEYSFEIVLRKLASKVIPIGGAPVDRDRRPRALVIRYGAYGDHLIASPLVRRLSEDGYHVTYNCTERAFPVTQNSPFIDEYLIQGEGIVAADHLLEYWEDLGKGYDKVVNLSESVEVKFLYVPTRPEYKLTVEERRRRCGSSNYTDYALELGEYFDVKRPRPELWPSPVESGMAAFFRHKFKDKFLVMWCLQGSALHKCYPFGQDVALEFLKRHKDAMTITVGDDMCRLIEWDHDRNLKKSGVWDIRSTLLMTKWVDLVISPETGVLNAAGCYDTPKIGMLTHSNKTNLVKHFGNDYSMQAEISCSPCHRMIYHHNAEADCPKMDLGEGAWLCACAGAFPPDEVLRRMEKVYAQWKEKRNVVSFIRPGEALRHWNRLKSGKLVSAK